MDKDLTPAKKKYLTYLRSGFRKLWLRSPERQECIKLNRRPYVGDNKRRKYSCFCTICDVELKMTEVHVDHLIALGPIHNEDSMPGWVKRCFFPGQPNLRVLCQPCHRKVTAEQRRKK